MNIYNKLTKSPKLLSTAKLLKKNRYMTPAKLCSHTFTTFSMYFFLHTSQPFSSTYLFAQKHHTLNQVHTSHMLKPDHLDVSCLSRYLGEMQHRERLSIGVNQQDNMQEEEGSFMPSCKVRDCRLIVPDLVWNTYLSVKVMR